MTPLQGILVAAVKASGRSQNMLARDAGLTEKHVSQMMTGRVEGTLSAWQAVLDAAGCNFDIIEAPPDVLPGGHPAEEGPVP
jgi:predicted transcriptional regulator